MFKNLKSLFVVEGEDGTPKSPEKVDKTPVAKETPIDSSTTAPTQKRSADPGKVTEQFTAILLGALEKNNIEGFDYLEFRQSLISLKKMDMDEPTRYKSAYAMAQTMGAAPDYLIKTADHYLKVLQEEEAKFAKVLANQKGKQIQEREQQLKKLDEEIRKKAEQIQKLSSEIEQHQATIQKLNTDISSASVKVASTKNNFVASLNLIVGQIKQDVENMKKYLK